MTDDATSEMGNQRIPPGVLKRWQYREGGIEVLAKLSVWVPGTPAHLFTFDAREIEFPDFEIHPPAVFGEDSPYSELRAYYSGDEDEVIVYYLDNWVEEATMDFAACLTVMELHELTHWAIPIDDNPAEDDTEHSELWHEVLREEVGWLMDIESWEHGEYVPPELPEREPPDAGEQATLTEVL